MGRLIVLIISLLIRTVVFGERFEKSSDDEIKNGMALLSLLSAYVIIFFHFHKQVFSLLNSFSTSSEALILIVPMAVIGAISIFASSHLFKSFSKRTSILICTILILWIIIEIIIRVKNVWDSILLTKVRRLSCIHKTMGSWTC